jgi:hypothetical protein
MTDDLHAPLGQSKPVKRRFPFVRATAYLTIGLLVLSLLGFAGWTFMVDDPLGGEPIAIASADVRVRNAVKKPDEPPIRVQAAAVTDVSTSDAAPPSMPTGTRIVTIIDGTSGKRQNVVVPEFNEKNAAPEDRLIERPRQGTLPKAGPEGPRAAKSNPAKHAIP